LNAGNVGIYSKPDKRATSIGSSRSAGVNVDEAHLTNCARADITNIRNELGRQLAFDEEVERVNFVALNVFWECCCTGVRWKRNAAFGEIRRSARVNETLTECGNRDEPGCPAESIETNCRHLPNVDYGIGVPDVLKRSWVGRLSI